MKLHLIPIFLLFCLVTFQVTLFAQTPKEYYESAKTEFGNGNIEQCLILLTQCQSALGGSNAKIESIKCQALVMKSDWINAAISYNNYEQLLPSSAKYGEGYLAMLDFHKTILIELAEVDRKEKEKVEKEMQDDLAQAEAQAATEAATINAEEQKQNDENETKLYEVAMQTKDKELLEIYKKEIGTSSTNGKNIANEIDKTNNPNDFLVKAILSEDKAELNYLLKLGANIKWTNSKGESLLHIAISESKINIFIHLIDLKADIEKVDPKGNTPLIKSIIENKLTHVNILLDKGANPLNPNTISFQPPFYYSLINSYTKSAEALIKKGISPNNLITLNNEKFTPLYLAVHKTQSILFAGFLISNGARINDLSDNKLTALIAAVNNKSTNFVNYLLNRGADINALSRDNRTALNWAVQNQDVEMSIYLIQRGGANKDVRDNMGNTAFLLSKELNNKVLQNEIKINKSLINLLSDYNNHEKQYLIGLEKLEILKVIHGLKKERTKKRLLVSGILVLTGASVAGIIIAKPKLALLAIFPGAIGLGAAGGLGFDRGKELRIEKRKIKVLNEKLLALGFK
jgi:ankyrin repeat protein